jgi:RNA polymerase sigma-70 factor, ECF subfamily
MKPEKPCNSKDLTHRAASGDLEVLSELVHCFEDSLLHFASRYCRSREDARDVVQDAYEAATKHLEGFRGQASIKTWLTRLVISACSRRKRGARNDPRRHVPMDQLSVHQARSVSNPPSAEENTRRREILLDIQKALGQLNQTDQAVLLLRDGKELSSKETARFLGLSVAAVKSRLHRARKRVRQRLEKEGEAA